jgi:hypothetical protein
MNGESDNKTQGKGPRADFLRRKKRLDVQALFPLDSLIGGCSDCGAAPWARSAGLLPGDYSSLPVLVAGINISPFDQVI